MADGMILLDRRRVLRTHCPADHEFTEKNTYHAPDGSRHCRQCRRERATARRRASGVVEAGTGTHCRKGLHEFTPENTLIWKGKRRQCKTCVVHARLARVYGISIDEYEALVAKQDGRCGGCQTPSDALVVDHDHDCGTVRGLLCHGCNLALGQVKDSIPTLLGLISYLEAA